MKTLAELKGELLRLKAKYVTARNSIDRQDVSSDRSWEIIRSSYVKHKYWLARQIKILELTLGIRK